MLYHSSIIIILQVPRRHALLLVLRLLRGSASHAASNHRILRLDHGSDEQVICAPSTIDLDCAGRGYLGCGVGLHRSPVAAAELSLLSLLRLLLALYVRWLLLSLHLVLLLELLVHLVLKLK